MIQHSKLLAANPAGFAGYAKSKLQGLLAALGISNAKCGMRDAEGEADGNTLLGGRTVPLLLRVATEY